MLNYLLNRAQPFSLHLLWLINKAEIEVAILLVIVCALIMFFYRMLVIANIPQSNLLDYNLH